MTGLPMVELSAMTGHLPASGDSGDSGAGGAGGVVVGLFLVILSIFCYFIPSFVAGFRGVSNLGSVVVVNFFLGWTFVGWVVALAMATRSRPAVEESGAKKCPDCAETVLAHARVCKHCGYRFAPPADGKAESKPAREAPKTREIEPQMNPPTSTNSLRRGDRVQILKTGHKLAGKTGKVLAVLSTGYVAVRVGLSDYAFLPDELKPKPESSN